MKQQRSCFTKHKENENLRCTFNDSNDSNSKGFEMTIEDAKAYITSNNGTNNSYFSDYKGGTVSVVCNQDGETVYEEEVR